MEKRLVILISGGGTNMQAVIDAIENKQINARVCAVVSSNHQAGGLIRAQSQNIKTYVCALKDFESNIERDKKIIEIAKAHQADYIVMAGYLGVCTSPLISAYKKRIINIHPALLPKFGGKGFFGLNVHKAVIDSKEEISGATVHYADEGTDTGEIIAYKTVRVEPNDTPESLQQRVLKEAEHPLLIQVLKDLCK